jgi:hypothetical protein
LGIGIWITSRRARHPYPDTLTKRLKIEISFQRYLVT